MLDLPNHEANFYNLWQHDGDEIEHFEGYDLIDHKAEVDSDDMNWLFPPKGPGEFKNMPKKKKKSKKNKWF